MLNLCFRPCSDLSVLKSVGLVKHPQFMSCIYITLFLVTMLIIAQQVVFVSSREAPTPLLAKQQYDCLCSTTHRYQYRVLIRPLHDFKIIWISF